MRVKWALSLVLAVLTVVALPSLAGYAQDGALPAPPVLPAIVGGQDADPGEYPWQAFVEVGPYMCGGSLIAPQWVLTAAHCIEDGGVVVSPGVVTVYLGKHDMQASEPSQQIRNVTQVLMHPSYNPNSGINDIALLKLSTSATLTARVQTISLLASPADDALAAPGINATVTGWGALEDSHSSWSPILQEVSIPIISNQVCNQALPGPTIQQTQICAGFAAGGKDSCYGDSGGPLIVPAGSGTWKQAGIVSYGYGCAQPNLYGVYTRVSSFQSWIGQYVSVLEVTGFAPQNGRPGEQITITGHGMQRVTSVMFAGTPAQFTATSDTTLLATMPQGAVAGPITLQSAGVTVTTQGSFEPRYQLDIQSGADGRVNVAPGGSQCTSNSPCTLVTPGGATYTLNPVADAGFVFAGWQGDCPALAVQCALFMDSDWQAIAVFAPPTSTLTVSLGGAGTGVVVSTADGIDCGSDCQAELPTRTSLVLTAQPDAGMIFAGWTGSCTGVATTCTVNMVGNQAVSASFEVRHDLLLPLIRR